MYSQNQEIFNVLLYQLLYTAAILNFEHCILKTIGVYYNTRLNTDIYKWYVVFAVALFEVSLFDDLLLNNFKNSLLFECLNL